MPYAGFDLHQHIAKAYCFIFRLSQSLGMRQHIDDETTATETNYTSTFLKYRTPG